MQNRNKKDDADGSQRRHSFDARVFRYAGLLAGMTAFCITFTSQIDAGVKAKTYEFAITLLVCSNKLSGNHQKVIKPGDEK
jgi:hypothetical protein